MSDLFWLEDAQMARLSPLFPQSHGKLWIDGVRVLIGIILIKFIRLRWRDTPVKCELQETQNNLFERWSDKGIFAQMMAGVAVGHGEQKTVVEVWFSLVFPVSRTVLFYRFCETG